MKKLIPFMLLGFITLLMALALTSIMEAQPYTNSGSGVGPWQYNDNLTQPRQPSRTLTSQYAAGINAGTVTTAATGLITNTFSTNYVYSVAPAVAVTQLGATQSGTNLVISVTTSNFVYQSGTSGTVASFVAVGH